jgi:hypothetical protein
MCTNHLRPRRLTVALLALTTAAVLSAFCNSGDGGSDTIDGTTLDDLLDQMVAAMFPDGGVMHSHENFQPGEGGATVTTDSDTWRSAATGEARIEAGVATPVIFATGARHTLDAGGAVQLFPYDQLEDNHALLGSVAILFNESADRKGLERVTVDGVDAIRIEVFLPTGDGTSSAKVYLSEADRLPIRVEYPNLTVHYEHAIVERDSLPADFFSPDALEAAADPD